MQSTKWDTKSQSVSSSAVANRHKMYGDDKNQRWQFDIRIVFTHSYGFLRGEYFPGPFESEL